ncbi:cytochrome oxidase assembly protein [Roseivirga sp. 4D4]|uniref:COX15/CtaA family protein n=1 Tax=Roseivirga sp. 4D4 TaxID=1889784 RepID=UPI00085329F2|nr:COX15/CtaA family protein [Roseivirga sp. 4D4]OEK01724.1 cytochrome oxidase assembly protein [Roseivirga sp. 4D4]
MSLQDTKARLFRRFSAVTIIAVYLLIAVGGIVRSTGSGMGCPDWPKCFGSWVPPTSVDELPADYKEDYVRQRVEKNKKFSKYLTALGFDDLAYQVENDPSILEEEDFNAVKTWVEYVNRLIGAVIGLLIFGTFVLSIRYWKKDRPITVLSFVAFVLVGFQGWIGSIVVSTNLLQWMITIHMLLAIVIVCLLIYVYFRSKREGLSQLTGLSGKLKWLVIACLLFTVIQVVLGTQVREGIDMVATYAARSEWISNLGLTFLIHRSYSLLLLALHVYMFYMLLRSVELKSITKWLLIIVAVEILSGAIMAYFGVPAFIQPIHLLLGTVIVGVQYYLLLLINHKQKSIA